MNPAVASQVAARFQQNIRPQPFKESCKLWVGPLGLGGYGGFSLTKTEAKELGLRQVTSAHRVAWVLKHGHIPVGLLVCHKCDIPLCVNDEHLFLGTRRDNLLDAVSKSLVPSGLAAKKIDYDYEHL